MDLPRLLGRYLGRLVRDGGWKVGRVGYEVEGFFWRASGEREKKGAEGELMGEEELKVPLLHCVCLSS